MKKIARILLAAVLMVSVSALGLTQVSWAAGSVCEDDNIDDELKIAAGYSFTLASTTFI